MYNCQTNKGGPVFMEHRFFCKFDSWQQQIATIISA